MKTYMFRGREITGAHANLLLKAIMLVLTEAPNATAEEVVELQIIVEDFGKEFERDLRLAAQEAEEVFDHE